MQVVGADKELENNILKILEERSAILRGHFLLASGLHTDTYIQCAKLHEVPSVCADLCRMLLQKARDGDTSDILDVDTVVSPAIGGILFGYEIARQLGVNFVFMEKVDGRFELRRGFQIRKSERILLVEDVITTGKSSLAVYDAVASAGAVVKGELSIVSRIKGLKMPVPVVSLLALDIKNYHEEDLPDFLAKIPVLKPGSGYLK